MSPSLTTYRPVAMSLSAACRIAVMAVVFAMVLSLALTPHADARPTGGAPAPARTR